MVCISIMIVILFVIWCFYGRQEYEVDMMEDINFDEVECYEPPPTPSLFAKDHPLNDHSSKDYSSKDHPSYLDVYSNDPIDQIAEQVRDQQQAVQQLQQQIIEPEPPEILLPPSKTSNKKMSGESRGEAISRQVLEKIYGKPFPKARPEFLKNPVSGFNLELDGFNEDISIAFEYNGVQHTCFPNKYHNCEEEFIKQVQRDKWKYEMCNKAGVYLITIPHTIPENRIYDYIVERLPENIIKYK